MMNVENEYRILNKKSQIVFLIYNLKAEITPIEPGTGNAV